MTIMACALAWLIAGAAVAAGLPAIVAVPAAAALALLIPARTFRRRASHLLFALGVSAISVVYLAPLPVTHATASLAAHAGETVRVLARSRDNGDRYPGSVIVAVDALAMYQGGDWEQANGLIELTLPAGADVRQNDEIVLSGVLEPLVADAGSGFDNLLIQRGFSAGMSFPRLSPVSRTSPSAPIRLWQSVRTRIGAGLAAVLAPREALFADALIYGDSHTLPRNFRNDLNRTGTSHLVVVSAFNLILLYGVLLSLLTPFSGRRRAILIALGAAVAYGLATGNRPPVVRGEILLLLMSAAALSGRPHSTVSLLILAAAAMTIASPAALGDISFQLTFAAAAGIATIAPPLNQTVHRLFTRYSSDQWGGVGRRVNQGSEPSGVVSAVALALTDAACVSIAVTVATLPFSVAAFHEISPYAPIANAVVIPLTPLITGLALSAGLLGSLSHVAGALAAAPLWLLLAGIEQFLHTLAMLPGAGIPIHLPAVPFAVGWYAVVEACGFLSRKATFNRSRRDSASATSGTRAGRGSRRHAYVAAACGVTMLAVIPAVSGAGSVRRTAGSSVRWLDVPGQMVLLIRSRTGTRFLVLSGGSAQNVSIAFDNAAGSGATVDGLLFLTSPTNGEEAANRASLALAVHAGTVFYPAAAGGPSPADTRAVPAVTATTGSVGLDMGGGDSLTLLTDGAGTGAVRLVLSGRRIIAGRSATVAYVLQRWQDPMGEDVLAILYPPGERTLDSLRQLHPAAVVVGGRSTTSLDLAGIAGESGVRVIAAEDTRDLAITTGGDGVTLSYHSR